MVNVSLQNNKIESELKVGKEEFLLNVLRKFFLMIEHALSIHLKESSFGQMQSNAANGDLNNNKTEEDANEKAKVVLKLTELAVECKLQTIDLLKVVNEFFIQDAGEVDDENQDEESWDECEETNNEVDMETEQHADVNHAIANQASANLIHNELKRLTLPLLKTISEDDHFSFSQVDHVYKGVRLVRNEAIDVYTQIMQNVSRKHAQTQKTNAELEEENICFKHLSVILDSIANFQTQTGLNEAENSENDLEEQAFAVKLSQLAHDLFTNFKEKLSQEQLLSIIETIKQILFKYKLNYADLSILLAKVLSLIAIKLRNECFVERKEAISVIFFHF